MPARPIPIYATIAENGGLFTIVFKPEGTTSHHALQGYSWETFEPWLGTKIPVVDFQTMKNWDGYNFPSIREAYGHHFGGEVPLAKWLDDVKARGAGVANL